MTATISVSGLMIAALALLLARQTRNTKDLLFQHILPGKFMIFILLWFLAAAGMRMLLFGRVKVPAGQMKFVFFQVGVKLSFMVSVAALLLGLILCMVAGSAASRTVVLNAFVSTLVIAAFSGFITQAIVNSAVVLDRLRPGLRSRK